MYYSMARQYDIKEVLDMRNGNVVSMANHMNLIINQLDAEGCTILSVFVDRHYSTDAKFSYSIQVLRDDAWDRWSDQYLVSRDEQDRPTVMFLSGVVFAYELQL